MALSPMMQQYHAAKKIAGEALLFFRMGDFYELFYEDAKTAGRIFGITVTSRDKGANPVPMAGFPQHQLDPYLAKVIKAGLRAAICEQVENPKDAKGIVKREIVRIVSPGTILDDALLDPSRSNFLVAVAQPVSQKGKTAAPFGIAWIDMSTGRFQAASCLPDQLTDQLARIAPTEYLIAEESPPLPTVLTAGLTITKRPVWAFAHGAALESLSKQFGTKSLDGFGFEVTENSADSAAIRAAGAVLDYLHETQKSSLAHIDRLLPYKTERSLQIDQATRRSLEITQTIRDSKREGSLLGVIDRTKTSMGARLLAEWLANPLADLAPITVRHDAVEELFNEVTLTNQMREYLGTTYDVERLLARVITGRASPRDLSFVGKTLAGLPKIKTLLAGRTSLLLNRLQSEINLCPEVQAKLAAALVEACPMTMREGGLIRDGYSSELDKYRQLMAGGKQWMASYQTEQMKKTGIPSIKVGFNKVFGYYLEVTHTHRDKVPDYFIRKQTLKNQERYITPELKEHEEEVLNAEERIAELEYNLFIELRETVAQAGPLIQATADALAEFDVLGSLADLARSRNYIRPEIFSEPILAITDGRHPVLDITEPEGTFVPNSVHTMAVGCLPSSESCSFDKKQTKKNTAATHMDPGAILLLTGPNMAGKSTYIRQAALLTLLAQIGSFVPAKAAKIGIADRIFARVGASDELSRGQSTFMVEMTETARILNTATERSLVILDEIGRGTSTYDGLSLAWSIVEHLHNAIGCRTLFATHYHELTDLQQELHGVQNLNVSVKEWEDQVVFLHRIVPGFASKSYGIHVAQLAGVPRAVNQRAREILQLLEAEHQASAKKAIAVIKSPALENASSKNTASKNNADKKLAAQNSVSVTPLASNQATNNRLDSPHTTLSSPRENFATPPAQNPLAQISETSAGQMLLFETGEHPLVEQLLSLDLDGLTPRQALEHLYRWQKSHLPKQVK